MARQRGDGAGAGDYENLIAAARERVAAFDAADDLLGVVKPIDRGPLATLAAVREALNAGLVRRDWPLAADALVMLDQLIEGQRLAGDNSRSPTSPP